MPQRIALISEHASPLAAAGGIDSGGQNIYVAQVARQLARLGYGVDVFTRRDGPKLPDAVDWGSGIRILHVPAGPAAYVRKEELLPYMPAFSEWIREFAKAQGGYRVAHANFFMSGLAALELKRALGIPFVITFHALGRVRRRYQGGADQFPPERLQIEELLVAHADGIVAECPQDEADLSSLYGASRRKIAVIPCGFDRAEFWPITRPFARRALGLPADQPILLNIGRMVPRKGVDTAIRALGRLARTHGIAARLIVVGGNSDLPDPAATPEIGRLQAIAEEEGVAPWVTFTGRRSREFLKLYYSAADLFVTLPWYEPFGITPLEAMACGTPVLGADVGGIRYSVAHGATGWLVPPNQPDAVAAHAAELLCDRDRLKDFARSGIRRVNAHFTWQKVARAIGLFYEEITAGSALRRRPARVAVAA